MARFNANKKFQEEYLRKMSVDLNKQKSVSTGKFKTVLIVLVVLWLASFIFGKVLTTEVGDKVAVITLEGPITGTSDTLFFSSQGVDSQKVVKVLKAASEAKNVKAIILEINSPGGTVVASKEIADAVKELDKPVVAVIREIGTSGAYWVASATDYIYADELSLTGSIGVNGGYLEFSGFMDKYGVGYQELKGGKFKDAGNPYEALSEEEKKILQSKIDVIHESFIKSVAENRGMEFNEVKKFSEGLYYLGVEAKEIGLIDDFGGMKEAKKKAEELAHVDKLEEVQYKTKGNAFSVLDLISAKSSYGVGRGIGDSLRSSNLQNSIIVPKA